MYTLEKCQTLRYIHGMYVLCGDIQCHIGNNIYNISKGDSICVPENNSHMIFNNSDEEDDYYEIENHVCAIEAMIEAQEPAND